MDERALTRINSAETAPMHECSGEEEISWQEEIFWQAQLRD
jgi:hypothetical protein